jgi:hypothetical protein
MTNKTLWILTGSLVLAMCLLFGLNLAFILSGKPENQSYIRYNEVRGSAVAYNQKLFTLNFQQQNELISMLNHSVKVLESKPGNQEKPLIEKIVIYQFENKPDLIIEPLTYLNGNLVYAAPLWSKNEYFMELSEGALKKLINTTYDATPTK